MENIELFIDGELEQGLPVEVHFQSDPFPGGHHFRLRLSGDLLAGCLGKFDEELDVCPNLEMQKELMFRLGICLEVIPKDKPDYVLNTITAWNRSGGVVELLGECSLLVTK